MTNEIEAIMASAIEEELSLGGDAKSAASAAIQGLRDDAPRALAALTAASPGD